MTTSISKFVLFLVISPAQPVASSCFLSVQWLSGGNKSFSKGPDRNVAEILSPKNLMFRTDRRKDW